MQIWSVAGFTFGGFRGLYDKERVGRRGVSIDVKPKNPYCYEIIDYGEDCSGGHVHVAAFRLVRCPQAL